MKNILLGLFALLTFLNLNCTKESDADKKGKEVTILNVSYDPTRELYQDINNLFIKEWENKTGDKLTINQSHAGSGKQARSVIDGLEADVVTLALAYDIDVISEKGKLIEPEWQKRLPHNSSPFTSTIVFLVRKGNPKSIKDWDDLIRKGVEVITPNPKTSGGARWNYLAAWAFAMNKFNNDENKVKEFMSALFKNVPVLDSGARGSTTTFVERKIGDVFLAWENEALLVTNTIAPGEYEIIIPSISILAEPPVSVVDKIVDKRGTREIAEAYLNFLFSEQVQDIGAKHFFRPVNDTILAKYKDTFKDVKLFTIEDAFGGWKNAQKLHFEDKGIFDQLYGAEN